MSNSETNVVIFLIRTRVDLVIKYTVVSNINIATLQGYVFGLSVGNGFLINFWRNFALPRKKQVISFCGSHFLLWIRDQQGFFTIGRFFLKSYPP